MPLLKNFRIYSLLLFLLISASLSAQELKFTVNINADAVQTTERGIFDEMKVSFERFFNDTKWTQDRFSQDERIKGSLLLTIQDQPSIGRFTANAQIQVIRPVYGTTYETLLLNFADRDWDFQYTPSQPIIFNENNFSSNLSSLLSFYAYIALGLDYDSFSSLGGEKFYETALNIVNNAQNSGRTGWGQFQSRRNRYWLIENLKINNQYQPVREAIYDYHRLGLDLFQEVPEKSRLVFFESIKAMQEVNRIIPNSILIIAFLDAKSDEITNIFSKGEMSQRREVYNELLKLDPTRRSKYQKIVQN